MFSAAEWCVEVLFIQIEWGTVTASQHLRSRRWNQLGHGCSRLWAFQTVHIIRTINVQQFLVNNAIQLNHVLCWLGITQFKLSPHWSSHPITYFLDPWLKGFNPCLLSIDVVWAPLLHYIFLVGLALQWFCTDDFNIGEVHVLGIMLFFSSFAFCRAPEFLCWRNHNGPLTAFAAC